MKVQEEKKLFGFYRGKVLKHLSKGFCKIYIPSVFPEVYAENADMLPSAEQASPLFGPSYGGGGSFSYPNIGATVVCFFLNGDQNLPMYFAATLGGPDAYECWDEARPNVSEDNIKSGQDAYVHKVDVHLTTVKLYEGGFAELVVRSDEDGTDNCKISVDGKGNVIVSTTQQVQVQSPQIKVIADQTFEVTSPQIKLNAGQSFELNTNTAKVTTSTECNVVAQDASVIGSNSVNVVSPSVNLDASTGAVAIKGAAHSAFFA